jgi:hypothetical protein
MWRIMGAVDKCVEFLPGILLVTVLLDSVKENYAFLPVSVDAFLHVP